MGAQFNLTQSVVTPLPINAPTTSIGGSAIAPTFAILVEKIEQTGQNADQNLVAFQGISTKPGYYRINWSLETEVADAAAGNITLQFRWTDHVQANLSNNVATTSLAILSIAVTGCFFMKVSGTATAQYSIVHSTTYGAAFYGLQMVVEKLALLGSNPNL